MKSVTHSCCAHIESHMTHEVKDTRQPGATCNKQYVMPPLFCQENKVSVELIVVDTHKKTSLAAKINESPSHLWDGKHVGSERLNNVSHFLASPLMREGSVCGLN